MVISLTAVADLDLELRRGGGGLELRRGGGDRVVQFNCPAGFSPSVISFFLPKIRGAGPLGPSPRPATEQYG